MATTPTDDPLANGERTVGVHGELGLNVLKSFKRDALLFDQIAFLHLADLDVSEARFAGSSILPWGDASFCKELRWLWDIGIVRGVPRRRHEDATSYRQVLDAIVGETGKPIDVTAIPDERLREEVFRRLYEGISENVRRAYEGLSEDVQGLDTWGPTFNDAVRMREHSIALRREGINAFPILPTRRQIGNVFPSGTASVLEVVLKSMPIPDDQTPWEDIIEFRNDPESRERLQELRVWGRKFAKETTATSLAEMTDEIEVLLRKYEKHMKHHRMKVNKGTAETILTYVGHALDFKFGEFAKLPFILKERKISLTEAELTAPNRELAYISMARFQFSK